MTVLVDVGMLLGANLPTIIYRIGDPLSGKIGVGQIANGVFTDVSERLLSLSVQRTSDRIAGPLTTYNAATLSLSLVDFTGDLDPANLPYPAPGSLIRVRYRHAGITYPVFTGYINSWLPSLDSPEHTVISVTATDGMSLISGFTRTASLAQGANEDTGARINRILTSVNWPAADRDITVGDSQLQATTLDGDALEEAQTAVKSEAGEFYIAPDGKATFRNRRALYTDARSKTSQATFGTGPGEIPYVGQPGLAYDDGQLVNTVRATIEGGTEQVAQDTASIARYRERPHPETGLMLADNSGALAWAKYVVRQDALPELRFTSITVDTRVDPDVIVPHALGRRFGDRITVVRRWLQQPADSRQVLIRSIEHTFTAPDAWLTTWGVSPADRLSYYVIGDPMNGRIGSNAIAW